MEINIEKLEQLKKDHKYLLINNIPPKTSLHFREYCSEPIYVRYINNKFDGWNELRGGQTAYEILGEEIFKYSIIEFTELLIKDSLFKNIFKNSRRSFKRL